MPKCTQHAPIPPGALKAFPEAQFSRLAAQTLTDPDYEYLPHGPNPKCGLSPADKITGYCQEAHAQVCGNVCEAITRATNKTWNV